MLCDCCAIFVHLQCECCAIAVLLLCDYYASNTWLLCGYCVIAVPVALGRDREVTLQLEEELKTASAHCCPAFLESHTTVSCSWDPSSCISHCHRAVSHYPTVAGGAACAGAGCAAALHRLLRLGKGGGLRAVWPSRLVPSVRGEDAGVPLVPDANRLQGAHVPNVTYT